LEPDQNKRIPSRYLVAAAVADYLLYWILVYFFPKIMIPVSALLALTAIYLRRNEGFLAECRETFKLSANDELWLKKWLSSWIVTAGLGGILSLFFTMQQSAL